MNAHHLAHERARTFKALREVIRPVIKTLIVDAALKGTISREKAARLIRERGLEDA